MSDTLATVVARARAKARDEDDRRPTFDPLEWAQQVCDSYLILSSRLPAPVLYTPSAFTIAANAETFTWPATVPSGMQSAGQYGPDLRIQIDSTKRFLVKVSREELDSMRNGNLSTSGGAPPDFWAQYEGTDQSLNGLCYPRNGPSAQPCNVFRSVVEDDLRDAAALDAASVHFSRYGLQALVLHVAATMVEKMGDEDLKLRKLNPRCTQGWRADMESVLYHEACRRHDLESTGRTHRFAS